MGASPLAGAGFLSAAPLAGAELSWFLAARFVCDEAGLPDTSFGAELTGAR
jgi:hypothetical protein